MTRKQVASSTFWAMGVTVTVGGVDIPDDELAAGAQVARAMAEDWEETFSRFRPSSELSRANASAGRPFMATPTFLSMLENAIAGVRRSGGRFNPAILPALESAGYDRTFSQVGEVDRAPERSLPAAISPQWVEEIAIDRGAGTVCLPAEVRLDFGGIAKGAYVDRLAPELRWWPGGFVDAGGDVRVWGEPPNGKFWTAGIQDPAIASTDIAVVELHDPGVFAMATSGTYKRRWSRGDVEANHLIDPVTGMPVLQRTPSVTVFAARTVDAEVESKSVLIAASRGEQPRLSGGNLAIMCHEDGSYAVIEQGERQLATVRRRDPTRASA